MSSSDASREPSIVLKSGRDAPIRRRHHPWVYSQAIDHVIGEQQREEPIRVCSSDGTVLGWGFQSPGSLIAVRMISFSAQKPGDDWIRERIARACKLRQSFAIDSDALRVVSSEGDFLPGLIVDLYGDTAVVSIHTRGMEAQKDRIVAALQEALPGKNIYNKRDEHYARVEGLTLASGYLHGSGDGTSVIREGQVRMRIDFASGQKTGFYLDLRENRFLIARCSRGKRVLNLFSYTGAIALHAAAAGAVNVVSVESSQKAVAASRENMVLNPDIPPDICEWVQADVFDFLKQPGTHDIVIADPPPFARRRSELEGAIAGYLSLFQQCLRSLAPGGIAFFFSCSGAVDRPTFQQVVCEAALRSGREVRLLRELHADVDHPVAASHPEGEYLKGWMVHAQ